MQQTANEMLIKEKSKNKENAKGKAHEARNFLKL